MTEITSETDGTTLPRMSRGARNTKSTTTSSSDKGLAGLIRKLQKMRRLLCLLLVPLLLGCGGDGDEFPVSTQPQLTATVPVQVRVETVLTGLDFPVALAFADDGRLFFNELRTGRVRVASAQGFALQPAAFATENVEATGERGLIGLAIRQDQVYLSLHDASGVARVVRYRDAGGQGIDRALLVDGLPSTQVHSVGNLAIGPDDLLYLSIGDGNNPANAQDPNSLNGSILRYRLDGTVPQGGPVYAKGLRNSFDLAFHPQTGELYASENGATCDDELNRILAGGNYGWRPGQPCDDEDPGFIQPLVRFNPSIAPTGVAVYVGSTLPEFNNRLLVTDFNDGNLRSYAIAEGGLTDPLVYVNGMFGPLFDVVVGPDGLIYFSSSDAIHRLRRL